MPNPDEELSRLLGRPANGYRATMRMIPVDGSKPMPYFVFADELRTALAFRDYQVEEDGGKIVVDENEMATHIREIGDACASLCGFIESCLIAWVDTRGFEIDDLLIDEASSQG